jgi:hypothetical protein
MGSLKDQEELEESNDAILYVNGTRRVLPDGLAHLTLLEYLRGSVLAQSVFIFSEIVISIGLVQF